MIPTLILVGLAIGILPRPWYFLGILIAAAAWPLLLGTSRPEGSIDFASIIGEFALAAANMAAGALVARLVVNAVHAVRG